MKPDHHRIRAEVCRDIVSNGFRLFIVERRLAASGATSHVRFFGDDGWLEWVEYDSDVVAHSVTDRMGLALNDQRAQRLMDSMWDAGLRPSHGVASAGVEECLKSEVAYLREKVDELLKERAPVPPQVIRFGPPTERPA